MNENTNQDCITREAELENIKAAYFLETKIDSLRKENNLLNVTCPKKPCLPEKPQLIKKQISIIQYPEIKSRLETNQIIILVLVLILFWPAAIFVYSSFKKNNIAKIENSEEYIEACKSIDIQNSLAQKDADEKAEIIYKENCAQYEIDVAKYREDTLYYEQNQLPEWEAEKAALESALTDTENVLRQVYSENIIPSPYRNLPALLYIYEFMDTSRYDLREAMTNWRDETARIQRDQANDLKAAEMKKFNEMLSDLKYQNYLIETNIDMIAQSNKILHSIDNWQKADISLREIRRAQAKKKMKKK